TSAAFTWTAYAAPTLTGLATNTATETAPESVPITYSCPRTSCTIVLTGAVPGLGLSTSSATTGNNTTTSLVVSSVGGTVYIAGTTQNTAVTAGTSKAYAVGLKITDGGGFSPATSTATWTAFTVPTVSGLSATSNAHGTGVSQQLTYACPAGGCTVAVSGVPSAIGLSASGSGGSLPSSLAVSGTSGSIYIRGTISNTATRTTYPVTVTITDANGAAASISATWTVT
ncbi:MAG: hypothetical protein JWO57_1484, partial [Pseudonocardiales bacterium]|nr:hypothetical protein [Pseudonocardiales bacterium]